MSSSCAYSRLDHQKHFNAEANGYCGEQTDDVDPLVENALGHSLDFSQPKTSLMKSLTEGCLKVKKKCYAASRVGVKFAFGKWPIALAVLISYITLTAVLIVIALTGKYHEFRKDISLNSFMVPDIKVSNDFSAFNAAKGQSKGYVPSGNTASYFFSGGSCPKNNINFGDYPSHRHKRDTLSVPYQRSVSSNTLDLVYVAKAAKGSNDTNIFTEERLEAIHKIEKKLMNHANFKKHCYISPLSSKDESLRTLGKCTPPVSLTLFFYPSNSGNYDGQGKKPQTIQDALKFLQSREYFYSFVSDNYDPEKMHSRILRAQLLFGSPRDVALAPGETPRAELKSYIRSYIEPLEKMNSDEKVSVLYGGGDLFDYLVERALMSDLHLAIISLVLINIFLLVLTFSPWLSFMAVLTIVSSVAVAYFFYRVVFGIEFMGILNGVSLFVIIGIGVDDIFVFVNTFRQAVDNKDLGDRIYHTISVAGKATLFTSFTTAAAFAANALSPIPAIHDFGLFMAVLVASCWISVVCIMSPALCLWNSGIEKLESAVCRTMLSLVGLRRSERLRLPDDIRQFLSGNRASSDSAQSVNDASRSNHLEMQRLVEETDDDDDPLLVIDDETPLVPEQPTDSLGFRLQSILYHFVAVPVVKARKFILVLYLVHFVIAIYFVTKLKVSTEQPKFFKADSNLQRWLELPTIALNTPRWKLVKDLNDLSHNRLPSKGRPIPPTIPPTIPRKPGTKQARISSPTTRRSTTLQPSVESTEPTSTRKTTSTTQRRSTLKLTTVLPTIEREDQETSSTATTSVTTDGLETTKSTAFVSTAENLVTTDKNSTTPTTVLSTSLPVNPCDSKDCVHGWCKVQNGSAICQCQPPYTGDSCSTYCPVRTVSGNCCVIPFTYNNKPQYGCVIEEGKKTSWCSLTTNYDQDKRRGNCNTTVKNQCEVRTFTPKKTCCTFPFVYEMVQYYYCIKLKKFDEHLYCGIHRHVSSVDQLRKCNITKPLLTTSAIGKLCKKESCKPAKKPTDGSTALVYLVFGIKGIDTRSIDRRHVLEDKKGNVLYDREFSLDMSCKTKDMITAACKICKVFASKKDLVLPGGADCFPTNVRVMLEKYFPQDCGSLPKPHRTKESSKSVLALTNGTKLKWFAMAFESTTGKLSSYSSQQKDYRKWNKQLKEVLSGSDIPKSLKDGFQTSETWVKMFSGTIVVDSAIYGIVVSLALCLAAVVIFTGHALLFVILFLTILDVLITVIAIFYLTGWQLGGVEAVSLSILVGTSVDYCFHLVEGYILAGNAVSPLLDEAESRQWRAKAAMSHIGMSIISSGLTTILAAIPLCLTQIQLFARFGLIVTINTGISLLYTMTVTMAMLSTFGPARFRASIKASLIGLLVVAVFVGAVFLILYLVSVLGGHCIPSPQGTPLFHC